MVEESKGFSQKCMDFYERLEAKFDRTNAQVNCEDLIADKLLS